MNKKEYWAIRKKLLFLGFILKRFLYNNFCRSNIVKYSLKKLVLIKVFYGSLQNIFLLGLLWVSDCIFFRCFQNIEFGTELFFDVVICGLGIAGVILGLFCSNISSVYASKYMNAPKAILDAFQNDYVMQKCITSIINYLILGLGIIAEIIVGIHVHFVTLLCFIFWTIGLIVSYSIVGRRAYELSNVYYVANDSFFTINRIITKNINGQLFRSDVNFQNHFKNVCNERIKLLSEIEKFGNDSQLDIAGNALEYAGKNLDIINEYWKIKRNIPEDSEWFKYKARYQKWHLTGNIMTSSLLRNGIELQVKQEKDYYWFEEQIFEINKRIIDRFAQKCDYQSLYKYVVCLESLYPVAIEAREVRFFMGHVDYFVNACKSLTEKEKNADERYVFIGLMEYVALLYLSLIINVRRYCSELDFEKIWNLFKAKFDNRKNDFYELSSIYGQDFINKLAMESQVFGKRITPDWVIKQKMASVIHEYIGELLIEIKDGINLVFELGKVLYNKGQYAEACIILSRFYEFDSKLNHLLEIVDDIETKIKINMKDSAIQQDSNYILDVKKTLKEWKEKVPSLLSGASTKFALDNWDNRDEYPDFLGGCYNHICEDAVEAIANGDLKQFEADFSVLSRLMLLYKEYIRTDLVKDNTYRVGFVYYTVTFPIVEWAQVGGLAILYGEFKRREEWLNTVYKQVNDIIGINTGIAEEFISYVQHRDKYMFGIDQRNSLELGWKKMVEDSIRKDTPIKMKYGFYGDCLDTDSDLLMAFCPGFLNWGFTSDPSEVFWIICVNPQLAKEKKFKSSNSWEEKIDVGAYLARITD